MLRIVNPGLVYLDPVHGVVLRDWQFDTAGVAYDLTTSIGQRVVAIEVLRYLVARAGLCPEDLLVTPTPDAESAAQAALDAARRPR